MPHGVARRSLNQALLCPSRSVFLLLPPYFHGIPAGPKAHKALSSIFPALPQPIIRPPLSCLLPSTVPRSPSTVHSPPSLAPRRPFRGPPIAAAQPGPGVHILPLGAPIRSCKARCASKRPIAPIPAVQTGALARPCARRQRKRASPAWRTPATNGGRSGLIKVQPTLWPCRIRPLGTGPSNRRRGRRTRSRQEKAW